MRGEGSAVDAEALPCRVQHLVCGVDSLVTRGKDLAGRLVRSRQPLVGALELDNFGRNDPAVRGGLGKLIMCARRSAAC